MTETYYGVIQKRLAVAIREHRKRLGWTQEHTAQSIGMATRHYQKLEAGELNITLRTLCRVANAFGVDIADLFCE